MSKLDGDFFELKVGSGKMKQLLDCPAKVCEGVCGGVTKKDCPDSGVGLRQLFFSCCAGDSSSWDSHSSSASVEIGCLKMKLESMEVGELLFSFLRVVSIESTKAFNMSS